MISFFCCCSACGLTPPWPGPASLRVRGYKDRRRTLNIPRHLDAACVLACLLPSSAASSLLPEAARQNRSSLLLARCPVTRTLHPFHPLEQGISPAATSCCIRGCRWWVKRVNRRSLCSSMEKQKYNTFPFSGRRECGTTIHPFHLLPQGLVLPRVARVYSRGNGA